MKVFGVNYSKPQKSNYVRFSGRANSYDELITIIPDYKNALERAAQKVGFYDKNPKPEPFVEALTKAGNKIRTFFQKDGKTPSYTVELNSKGEKIRSVFFDLDGKTPLYENNYNE